MQVELPAVRILSELLGFLLTRAGFPFVSEGAQLTPRAFSVYNDHGLDFFVMIRRRQWNGRLAQCGRVD